MSVTPDPTPSPRAPFQVDPALPDPLPDDPIPILTGWFARARRDRVQPNPDAVALATADARGRPGVRIVLCKQVEPDGSCVFYTNYDSRKGRELAENPAAAIVFHWDALDLQARAEGEVAKTSDAESDAYFASRPWSSRIGAWASRQSSPVASRRDLLERVFETMREHGIDPLRPPPPDAKIDIPRPPNWGGYRLRARAVELWVGGTARVHDRARWTRRPAPTPGGTDTWKGERLQP